MRRSAVPASFQRRIAALFLAILFAAGCRPGQHDAGPTPAGGMVTAAPPAVGGTAMSLLSVRDTTQYSPRPSPFTPPASLDQIAAPPEESWQAVAPSNSVAFQSYDNLRVSAEGEALLDLGGYMQLRFKRDTLAQFTDPQLATDQLARISIDTGQTPPLQRLQLSVHLLRGGFSGELRPGSGPIALTTPNAVILVSGTSFYLAYDPETGRSWAGNLGGTIDVGGEAMPAVTPLDDRQLVVIPPVNGRSFWALPPGLTLESLARLIDATGSPLGAARVLSAPNLVVTSDAGLDIYHGPGRELERLGVLPLGEVAPILRAGLGQAGERYYQIACPVSLPSPRRGCWVPAEPSLAAAQNTEELARPVGLALESPAGDCAAGGALPVFAYEDNVALTWRGPDDTRGDYLGLRLGPTGGLLIFGTADPAANLVGPGEWRYTVPASVFYRPGVDVYQWQVFRANPDGVPADESGAACFRVEPPRPAATPFPDSDGDGWPDAADACVYLAAGPRPNPNQPGCPYFDSDGDGWLDDFDVCPGRPAGPVPDALQPGCPAPTPTPTPTPSPTPTPTPTATPTPTPSDTPTPTPTKVSPFGPKAGDSDGDGVPDDVDKCPGEPAGKYPDPNAPGCPWDRDGDGVVDADDWCIDVSAGKYPDPNAPGCPWDRDGDGVLDADDQCIDRPAGKYPDPDLRGCPLPDRDGDGVPDIYDHCPDDPEGRYPNPDVPGCPLPDGDVDGVPDIYDKCPDIPEGRYPNPDAPGCPLPDRDSDGVPDVYDVCPDEPAGDNPDVDRPGCPVKLG